MYIFIYIYIYINICIYTHIHIGTTIVGNFSKKLQHVSNFNTTNVEEKKENPYLEGDPDGPVEVYIYMYMCICIYM
jgi:hypothetical protein